MAKAKLLSPETEKSYSRYSVYAKIKPICINQLKSKSGFTIVELLVVIVIIGILASIALISYTGISQSAIVAQLQSDLKNNATILSMDKIGDMSEKYPSSVGNANNGRGLVYSNGTTLSYEYSGLRNEYCLQATYTNGTSYYVTSADSIPSLGICLPIGGLASMSPTTIVTGSEPSGIVVSPDGKSVYVTNSGSNTISMYNRNTITGELSNMSPATIAANNALKSIAISPDGTSVYVTNGGTIRTVTMFSRNTTTGALTLLSPSTVATGYYAHGIAISPDGKSVYITNMALRAQQCRCLAAIYLLGF
jgi:prepilin-type N-terminal cleavage/methylation domain-containing protein